MSKQTPTHRPPLRRRLKRPLFYFFLLLGLISATAWLWMKSTSQSTATHVQSVTHAEKSQPIGGMVRIPAGQLPLGSHFAINPADCPLPTVHVESFWMDITEVTNRQFAEFVSQTNYKTVAERAGSSNVYLVQERRWQEVEGADWRHPLGRNSSIAGRDHLPVVQVSWQDAAAYAHWAGKRLPTEYEWEYAARGGLYDAEYPWGRNETPDGAFQANTWQGWFPDQDRGTDGFTDLAPVGSFLPNPFGLMDMSGNVWEWCEDLYTAPTNQTITETTLAKQDPLADSLEQHPLDMPEAAEELASASSVERRIRRGGSWLCCENYSLGMRLSTRSSVPATARSNHLGFRCVSDQPTILPLDTATRSNNQDELTR